MFNVGGAELFIILLLALVVLGPDKLPGAMRTVGQWAGEMRKMANGFQTEMNKAITHPLDVKATEKKKAEDKKAEDKAAKSGDLDPDETRPAAKASSNGTSNGTTSNGSSVTGASRDGDTADLTSTTDQGAGDSPATSD